MNSTSEPMPKIFESTPALPYTLEQAEALQAAATKCPVFVEGRTKIPKEHLVLYYRNPQTQETHHVQLPPASPPELTPLLSACDPATFGLNNQDVLDPTYRKASKLNVSDFALHFSPERAGIIDEVQRTLINAMTATPEGKAVGIRELEDREIYAELYKLNMYSEGDFFKVHKDTPRSDNMLGSLVIGLPSGKFERGELVIRESDGTEHIVDWSQFSSTADANNTALSWTAFYSETEHEILPVKSGHRLTLTYNLYFMTPIHPIAQCRLISRTVPPPRLTAHPFHKILHRLLHTDQTFLPTGGRIIYHLTHQYPTPTSFPESTDPWVVYLKGADRHLHQIGLLLALDPKVKMNVPTGWEATVVISQPIIALAISDSVMVDEYPQGYPTTLDRESRDFVSCLPKDDVSGYFRGEDFKLSEWNVEPERVLWLNKPKGEAPMRWEEPYIPLGNQATIDWCYGDGVLAFYVDAWEEGNRVCNCERRQCGGKGEKKPKFAAVDA